MAVKSYSKARDGAKKLSEHFIVREFACPGSDVVKVDPALIEILERLYDFLGCSKIIITSGYRTPAYDRTLGCSGRGYHTTGQAADVNCWHKVNGKEERYHGSVICCALQELGWNHGIGWIAGCAVHIDTRSAQYWFDEQNNMRSIGKDWYAYMSKKGCAVERPDTGEDLNVTGTFGAKTRAAVESFQKKNGLTADGLFGVKSLNKAKSVAKGYEGAFPTLPARGYLKYGDKGEDVKRLQALLNWCRHG